MAMPFPAPAWTRDDVLVLPDDGPRYELVDGRLLVTPSPSVRHQRAVWRLYDFVAPFVARHGLGLTGLAPADLDLGAGQLLQPDLFVTPVANPAAWAEVGIPILVVEVLSRSTARQDRTIKRRRYQASGVGEYWTVDPDARLVERWRPGDQRAELVSGSITWQPAAGGPALIIDLDRWLDPAT